MPWAIRGLIEGFYGRPWSWDERAEVMAYCHQRGMTHYVYAPKDDPKHRDAWREPYDDRELDGFRRLLDEGTLHVGFAISPGLSMEYGDAGDRAALAAKVDQLVALGIDLVCLALDDISFRPGLGEEHAAVTTWLREHLAGRADLLLVPTEYVGTRRTPYLAALADGVPPDVPIAWTGVAVVNDGITADEARERAASLGGRAPLIWDNYPVNDGEMGDRLFLGPLRGRDPELAVVCSGYLANPMVQPRASRLPLASVAAFLRGEEPDEVWAVEAEARGLRVFAEACDGEAPRRLVGALVQEGGGMGWADVARPLARWLQDAAVCEAPGLAGEADEWVEQAHREAKAGLDALRAIQLSRPAVAVDEDGSGRAAGPDDEAALGAMYSAAARAGRARKRPRSVMGVRWGFRPAMGQRSDGVWQLLPEALQEDENALDRLVRLAMVAFAAPDPPGPLRVMVDGDEVEVDGTGRFEAAPGAVVLARCGELMTRLRVPGALPLPDPRLRAPARP